MESGDFRCQKCPRDSGGMRASLATVHSGETIAYITKKPPPMLMLPYGRAALFMASGRVLVHICLISPSSGPCMTMTRAKTKRVHNSD